MKIDVKQLPKSEVEITVHVPYDEYLKGEKRALEALGKEVKADGFRKGHIPEEVIRQKVGKEGMAAATLEHVVPDTYARAIKEKNLPVIAPPKIDVKKAVEKEGDELVYTAVVAVLPEVKLGNYKKIKVARETAKVEKKQVDETVDMILERFATWSDVQRPCKTGDRVEVDFAGHDEKDVPIPNTASKNHPLILGSKTMVPGFEEAIVGLETGGSKTFDVTFPKDYHAAPMKGKKVTFKLTLNRVEERQAQVLDEALVEKITGRKNSVDDFRKQVEDDLKEEMTHRLSQDHDNKVVAEIIKITQVDLPQALIDEEVQYMLQDRKAHLKKQGMEWDQYLRHLKKTEEDFKKDHQKPAEERLKARLGIQEIMKAENITASEEETEAKIAEIAKGYPEAEQGRVREYYQKDSEGYRSLKGSLAADKLIALFTK